MKKKGLRDLSNDTFIDNVKGFLEWIHEVQCLNVPMQDGTYQAYEQVGVYYRGQANESWDLEAGIFRKDNELLRSKENTILRQADLMLWNETASCKSNLEKLIFFQHYGLATRLLDVTFNPLVALYMACGSTDKNFDGVVYCGFDHHNTNQDIAEFTAKSLFQEKQFDSIEDVRQFATTCNVKSLGEFSKPLFILPPINNPRIEAQNGAFLLTPLLQQKGDSFEFHSGNLKSTGFFDPKYAIIKGEAKEEILSELAILGIDEGTLYKDISAKLRAIMQKERYNSYKIDLIPVDIEN